MNKKIINAALVIALAGIWVLIGYNYVSFDSGNDAELKPVSIVKPVAANHYMDSLRTLDPFSVPHFYMVEVNKPVKKNITPATPEQPLPQFFLAGLSEINGEKNFIIADETGQIYHMKLKEILNDRFVLNLFKQDTLWIYEKSDKKKKLIPVALR